MKNIPTFEAFLNESVINESNDYKTKSIKYTDLEYSDFVADGPEVSEISMFIIIANGKMKLVRLWSKDPKKNPVGEEFEVQLSSSDKTAIKVTPTREFTKNVLQPVILDWVKKNK